MLSFRMSWLYSCQRPRITSLVFGVGIVSICYFPSKSFPYWTYSLQDAKFDFFTSFTGFGSTISVFRWGSKIIEGMFEL